MAEYIKDDGSYGVNAILSGNYTTTSDIVTMTDATGQGDTGITLSQTLPFIVVETYDIDGTAGALSYHFWTDDDSDVATYIAACQTKVEAEVTASNYTTYDMKATYFDGDDAHIYVGDEATSFPGTANYTKVGWAPPTGTWKITNTLVAPVDELYSQEIYLTIHTSTEADPTGITINTITGYNDTTTEHTLVDKDNTATDVTFKLDHAWSWQNVRGEVTGDDSGVMYDKQLESQFYNETDDTLHEATFSGLDNAKTYTVQLLSSKYDAIDIWDIVFSMSGETSIQIDPRLNTTDIAEFTGVSPTSGSITFGMQRASGATSQNTNFNAVNIFAES